MFDICADPRVCLSNMKRTSIRVSAQRNKAGVSKWERECFERKRLDLKVCYLARRPFLVIIKDGCDSVASAPAAEKTCRVGRIFVPIKYAAFSGTVYFNYSNQRSRQRDVVGEIARRTFTSHQTILLTGRTRIKGSTMRNTETSSTPI